MKNGFQTSKDAEKKCVSLFIFFIGSDYHALLPKVLYLCDAIFMVCVAISEIEMF